MAKWPYSTARWQRLRMHQLQAEPLCAMCAQPTPATVVDHKTPHRGDPGLAFDPVNLQSLCKPHHDAAKALEERHGYSPTVGDDGWPTDARHPANRRR
jgi:5-methylcytosine-specific restriction endonuclease McrA